MCFSKAQGNITPKAYQQPEQIQTSMADDLRPCGLQHKCVSMEVKSGNSFKAETKQLQFKTSLR